MNRSIVVLLLVGLLSGCFGGTGKTPFIRQYVLEYPPTQGGGTAVVEAMVRVERFSADRLFMGKEMLYRQGPFRREAYPVQRWRISPADMVTEFIRRDLRLAGLFSAVLGERDAEDVRFSLAGGVEEFFESRENQNRRALLAATVTLLDNSRKEMAEFVVLQKSYRIEAAIEREGAAGMAEAMSRAMADLSRQVITDIAKVIR